MTEHQLNMWRASHSYDDTVFEFLWGESKRMPQNIHVSLQLAGIFEFCCTYTAWAGSSWFFSVQDEAEAGDPYESVEAATLPSGDGDQGAGRRDQWVTKTLDCTVTKAHKKKRRTRKNSNSKLDVNKSSQSAVPMDDYSNRSTAFATDDVDGFCVVQSSCSTHTLNNACSATTADTLNSDCSLNTLPSERLACRVVRFGVDSSGDVDTEDYNADADTDDLGACSEDVDTDIAVTDHDDDTEGYNADADDTEGYHADADDTDQCDLSATHSTDTKTHAHDKQRLNKKKNKKGKTRLAI